MFTMDDFKKINGFSNKYWGWGFEDDDLLFRCKLKNLNLNAIPLHNKGATGAALKFNGQSSYIAFPNKVRTRGSFTINISLDVSDYTLDPDKREDKYTVFGIPGFDFNIMYTSFRRFSVEFFDGRKKHEFIYSGIAGTQKTSLTFVYTKEENRARLYQGSNLIGEVILERPMRLYDKEPTMYLGCSDPDREKDNNFFRGSISHFALWNTALSYEEIITINNNYYFGLADNFESYKSAGNLVTYADAKFIQKYMFKDLSGLNEDGKIVDCELIKYDLPKSNVLRVPHRRPSDYKTLKHEDNGFLKTGWKDITTRYNQLRFMNEVLRGYGLPEDDGLTTLKYKLLSHSNVRNVTQMTVNI